MLDNNKFRFSASEMITFTYNFNLIVGHLIPDKRNNKYWKLYLLIRQITLACFSHFITKYSHGSLKIVVETHNALFVKLFGEN